MRKVYFIAILIGLALAPIIAEKLVSEPQDSFWLAENVLPGSVVIFCGDDTISAPDISVTPAGSVYVHRTLDCDSMVVDYIPLNEFLPELTRHRKLWGTGTAIQRHLVEDTISGEVSFRTSGSLLRGLRISNTGEVNSTLDLTLFVP